MALLFVSLTVMTYGTADNVVTFWTRMLFATLAIVFSPVFAADDQSERRVLIGVKLFPALLAADQDIDKKVSLDGKLRTIVLFKDNSEIAKDVAARLSSVKAVRNHAIHVSTLRYSQLATPGREVPAALFLAEWSPDDLPRVVQYGITHQRIVFSPFLGDVTKGATAGIFVGDRILPLVNSRTLSAAGITLKPFFLEVARTDE